MKAWREQLRGDRDGDALAPDILPNVDLNNEVTVRAAVLDVLR